MAHQQLHEANQLRNKEDEREDNEAKERMTKNFADDITIQYAHGANAECSTPGAHARMR